ncbi:MAG: PadR family transcriptional regulator [Candidatus Limnocylindrales bacterium]
MIQEIGELSEGSWTPSPGSIYPVLQQLEDEGLLSFERVDGRKTATLTPEGQTYVEEHREELGTPWEAAASDHSGAAERKELMMSFKGFVHAWKQVIEIGTPEQQEQAIAALGDARKAMYRILADDDA